MALAFDGFARTSLNSSSEFMHCALTAAIRFASLSVAASHSMGAKEFADRACSGRDMLLVAGPHPLVPPTASEAVPMATVTTGNLGNLLVAPKESYRRSGQWRLIQF